jgi:hypothetical protein
LKLEARKDREIESDLVENRQIERGAVGKAAVRIPRQMRYRDADGVEDGPHIGGGTERVRPYAAHKVFHGNV